MAPLNNEEVVGLVVMAEERGWTVAELANTGHLDFVVVFRHQRWSHGDVTFRSETKDIPRLKALVQSLPDLSDPEV